jgi:glucan 1,3-beta-glucosidase
LPTFAGSDRIAVEQHPYYAFNGKGSEDVVPYIPAPCGDWGPMMNATQTTYGVATAGEWSLAFNDCGLMLHSTADEHTTTDCSTWDYWETWTPEIKQNLMSFAMSNMDALQHWFFWTWKIGPSAVDGMPRSPLWSYQLGLQNGWIPLNPRDAFGHCVSLGVAMDSPFDGPSEPYQTGGGDGVIDPSIIANYGLWPPTSIGLVADALLLPTYTATGPVPTLSTETFPTPTPAPAPVDGGDGWYNTADTTSGMITVSGCPYPNPWDATAAQVPMALCTGA